MFEKAVAVDSLARAIAAHADEMGWTSGHAAALDAAYPPLAGEIFDHIDLGQIHASLNVLVNNSENALAAAVEPLGSHCSEVRAFVEQLGFAAGFAHRGGDLQQVWDAMDQAWLDGMPCDGFVSFAENKPDCICWTVALDPHPANGYAELRAAWLRGFCRAASIDFETIADGTFQIRKAA